MLVQEELRAGEIQVYLVNAPVFHPQLGRRRDFQGQWPLSLGALCPPASSLLFPH